MKFIRKGGRVIPIREKGDINTEKIDFKRGAAVGLASSLFFKKLGGKAATNPFKLALQGASLAGGIYTSYHNQKQNTEKNKLHVGSFLGAEVKGYAHSILGAIAGGGAGAGALLGLNKLNNLRKAGAFARKAKTVVKVAGYLK